MLNNDSAERTKAEKLLNLITKQITLMQTYVDDLLDSKQLKEGVFNLVYAAFDPNETFDLIKDMFFPTAS